MRAERDGRNVLLVAPFCCQVWPQGQQIIDAGFDSATCAERASLRLLCASTAVHSHLPRMIGFAEPGSFVVRTYADGGRGTFVVPFCGDVWPQCNKVVNAGNNKFAGADGATPVTGCPCIDAHSVYVPSAASPGSRISGAVADGLNGAVLICPLQSKVRPY